ncbi:MAG: response regulator transcription factor [Verrucomicrobiota bacterium]|nr:response regulator transcription factor [Verrucomicrobiota bacterium]
MSKSKPLILIVEDEKELASLIAEQIEAAGMVAQTFHRAGSVLPFLSHSFANLMLLDISLPDMTGFALVEELKKQNHNVPIIFLTANTSEISKVKALEMGGDDYVTKPFSFPELIARIRAVLRRAETAHDTQITQNASLNQETFDFCGAQVHPIRLEIEFPNGVKEKIGRKELGILTCLVSNASNVLTRRSLIHAVWGVHADVRSRSLDQYIVKLRNLYIQHKCSLDAFRTIHGVGYLYEPSPTVVNKQK